MGSNFIDLRFSILLFLFLSSINLIASNSIWPSRLSIFSLLFAEQVIKKESILLANSFPNFLISSYLSPNSSLLFPTTINFDLSISELYL